MGDKNSIEGPLGKLAPVELLDLDGDPVATAVEPRNSNSSHAERQP